MPHATGLQSSVTDEDDDVLISRVLNPGDPHDLESGLDLQRELEPGEKADDAVDFGDLSDDDLADDDGNGDGQVAYTQRDLRNESENSLEPLMENGDLPLFTKGNDFVDENIDDLFGDNPSSPVQEDHPPGYIEDGLAEPDEFFGNKNFGRQARSDGHSVYRMKDQPIGLDQPSFHDDIFEPKDAPLSREQQLQMELFEMSKGGQEALPAPPENEEELLASLWPKFKRDSIPKFIDLLPPKKARYVGKTIPKRPKPLAPTKVNLELSQDQEKTFKMSAASNKRSLEEEEEQGLITMEYDSTDEDGHEQSVGLQSDYENETVGGVSWQDLQLACGDWEIQSLTDSSEPEALEYSSFKTSSVYAVGKEDHDENYGLRLPAAKKLRLDKSNSNMIHASRFSIPTLHDPEAATSKIAKTLTLDLNDSRLLLDHFQPSAPFRRVFRRSDLKKAGRGAFTKGLSQRYNISNDEAYDLLKENHQSKVRSMLGNVQVEHSLPALKLQWPFYKTKLDKQDARAFHRPTLKVNRNEYVLFGKPKFLKRKHLKGKAAPSVFQDSKDLSLGDNSNLLLLEYSEEYPTMISNVGMGNRIMNYYRRKTMEDTSRPKLDVGETAVLLPQDKSPFSIFGHVDPGQATPTLYNSMYRAPVFKQAPRDTDFLVVRNTTGMGGSTWFIKNIESLYAVGQEFPSVDVPGPHSRKVTTASKNRLKMISYRLIRKNKNHRISVGGVTRHFADTTDMQNRQKMKEFMQFNKEHKEWQMRPGESVPEEETLRSMVKPEDVCLLESMQVGQQHLHDAGFSKEDDESDADDAKEGQSVEQQLAPWYTSRNFLHATQGKAMLALHGEGDPSGRGEAFSFIKTSMKGGFKAAEASATEKMRAKQMRDSNGHAYNVQEQQKSYEQSIRRIWETQKQSLSSRYEQVDSDIEDDPIEETSKNAAIRAETPGLELRTPVSMRRRDDETASQFTQHSSGSQVGRILRITRNIQDEVGTLIQKTETIKDAKVIRQYLKRKNQIEEDRLGMDEMIRKTGDAEKDKRKAQLLAKELARLEKNRDRRLAREKGKGHFDGAADDAGSPSSAPTTAKNTGTQRKCANCGQVGHIKTNKKLCPMLNGTLKPEDDFRNSAFTMGATFT